MAFELLEVFEVNTQQSIITQFTTLNIWRHAHEASELEMDNSITSSANYITLSKALKCV